MVTHYASLHTNAVNEDLQPRTWCIACEYEMMNDIPSINLPPSCIYTTMECGDNVIPADQLNLSGPKIGG